MCRAFLSPWYERGGMNPADENDTPVFVGRFNIGAVSLHLPMIYAKAKQEGKDFYEVLDEIDLAILKLKIEGKNLEEIADILGFRTHSAIHKRIKRIQQNYLDFDPDFRKEYYKKYKNKKVS